MRQLLTETNNARVQREGRRTYIEGVFCSAEVVNRNRRKYPAAVLEHAIDQVQDKIREGKMWGQFGHPSDMTGDPTRTSHIVESLTRRGNDWIGRARVLSEGAGRIVQSILACGGALQVSTRGIGEVREEAGCKIIQPGFVLKTVDIVEDASNPASVVKAIHESLENDVFSLNEADLAMRYLQDWDPSGKLAAAQKKFGADWDNTLGNFIPGHAGFPSAMNDPIALKTQLQRWGLDNQTILRVLDAMKRRNPPRPSVLDDVSQATWLKYGQAIAEQKDPFKRQKLVNERNMACTRFR